MARGIEGNEVSTPKPAAKKTTASSKSEKGQGGYAQPILIDVQNTPQLIIFAGSGLSYRVATVIALCPSQISSESEGNKKPTTLCSA